MRPIKVGDRVQLTANPNRRGVVITVHTPKWNNDPIADVRIDGKANHSFQYYVWGLTLISRTNISNLRFTI